MCSVQSISENSLATNADVIFSNWFIVGQMATTTPLPLSIFLACGITVHGSPRSIITISTSVIGIFLAFLRSCLCIVTYFDIPAFSIFFLATSINLGSTSNVSMCPRGLIILATNVVSEPLPVPISTTF